jgi:hypothetical protein
MSSETFVEEEFLGPVDTDTSRAAYLGEKPEVGDAFKAIDKDNYEVKLNANERIAAEVPNLKEENELLKIKLGKALGKETPGGKKDLINIDTSSLGSFASSIGNSFMNIAKEVPKRIDEISKDPEKKRNFMRGLEIIEASSGIKPISQAKSPLGAISEGLLKAEKGFIATDIAKLKAMKKEGRRYESPAEKLIAANFGKYQEKVRDQRLSSSAVFEKYNLARKVALEKNQLPTGIFNATFAPLKKFIQEAGMSKQYDELAAKFLDKDYKQMSNDDQTKFNDLFQAATYQQVVQEIKLLYPVSNKDIDTMLKTKGDISTNPEALKYLIAGQMAVTEIAKEAEKYAYKYFEQEDQQFETKSIKLAEKEIVSKLRKKVNPATLKSMFGSAEGVTDAGYIAAYYYQQLQAEKKRKWNRSLQNISSCYG